MAVVVGALAGPRRPAPRVHGHGPAQALRALPAAGLAEALFHHRYTCTAIQLDVDKQAALRQAGRQAGRMATTTKYQQSKLRVLLLLLFLLLAQCRARSSVVGVASSSSSCSVVGRNLKDKGTCLPACLSSSLGLSVKLIRPMCARVGVESSAD